MSTKPDFLISGAGGGGKGGGGSARVAVESPDTLRSAQFAQIVDVLSEGEIVGLVDGLKSVYLNETPIQNADGSMNFSGVTYSATNGVQMNTSGKISGILGNSPAGYAPATSVKTSVQVSVEVRKDQPVVRTVLNPDVDWVDVVIGLPQLTYQNPENGDISGTEVSYAIDVQSNGGGFRPQILSQQWTTDGFERLSVGHFRSTGSDVSRIYLGVNYRFDKTQWMMQYRLVGDTTWLSAGTTAGRTGSKTSMASLARRMVSITLAAVKYDLPVDYYYESPQLTPGRWEARIVKISDLSPLPETLVVTTNNSNSRRGESTVTSTHAVTTTARMMTGADYERISGKCSSRYQRAHKIYLAGEAPWDIRVRRLTDESVKVNLQNKTFWDLYTEGVDAKLAYSNTAVVAINIESEQFSSIPVRGYEIKGLRVKVPSNYDPVARSYFGTWDGTFTVDWTDNPAWCFYDMLTNDRYGLGGHIEAEQVDKWTLYSIAKYCDELVPNGFGSTEPRFTCNLYMQTREESFKVLSAMASIFRSMIYFADGMISLSQDRPRDPIAIFSSANVVEGMFSYQGADRYARHTVALVGWNDPAEGYRQKIEYVADEESMARWGVIEAELTAFGCTSRGQAHRMGKWLLYTEKHESELVSFRAGLDSARIQPGEIISIQDSVKSGKRYGGRIAAATVSSVTIDAPVIIELGQDYEITVKLPDGKLETRTVSNGAQEGVLVIYTDSPFSVAPTPSSMWVLSSSGLVPEQWRVISIVEVEPTIVEISAMYYNPNKFLEVEQGISLPELITSNLNTRPTAVGNLTATTEVYKLNDGAYSTRVSVSFSAPENSGAARYEMTWRRDNENTKTAQSNTPGFDIENAPPGIYAITVQAINGLGVRGSTASIEHVVEPPATAVGYAPDVAIIEADPDFKGRDLPLKWSAVPGALSYEIKIFDANTLAELRTDSVKVNSYIYTFEKNSADNAGSPKRFLGVKVAAQTLVGKSENTPMISFSNLAPAAPVLGVEEGPGQVTIMADPTSEDDVAGTIIWMGFDNTVPMTVENQIYVGRDIAFTKVGLQPAKPVYFRAAFFDHFGKIDLTPSTVVSAIPTATGGVLSVSELPLNPEAAGGELAVFLDVAQVELRGLYGWDGSQWISTSSLLDGSVTTNKLAPGSVDFTKMATGAVQAKNLSVKKHFLY